MPPPFIYFTAYATRFSFAVNTDFAFRLFRLFHKRTDGFKYNPKLRIVFLFKSFKLFCKICMRGKNLAQLHKCPHDPNVNLNGAFAFKTFKHGHTLFGECSGQLVCRPNLMFQNDTSSCENSSACEL